ncbi:LutC/YkgG family protein [Dokdonella sp. MW10]|uniref:LutC/YkgG family protein n=1 Tax=Dokdonella sp. MW10 TaxID=2992926 RepID=UPI003F809ACF
MSAQASQRARSAIFARLRDADAPVPHAVPDVQGYYDGLPATPGHAATSFAERARGWQAEVIETTPEGWPAALAALVAERRLRRVLAGRDTAIADTLAAVLPSMDLHWYDESLETFKPTLFNEVDAGITTTLGGIAETGSLILWPDVREPRTLSLVPPLHIAILRASTLQPTLHAAMHAQGWAAAMPTNVLLVTGPSKTADIQRLLVYGAHGPKQLVILLVRDEAST